MTGESATVRKNIYTGAVHGIVAWAAYAVVECVFLSILPWFIEPGYAYKPLHWGFTVLLFIIYPAIGLVLGGLFGLVSHKVARRILFLQNTQPAMLFKIAATFTIVLVFSVNLVINNLVILAKLHPLVFSLLVIGGLVLSVKSSVRFRWLRFLTNPWTVSIILLVPSWINQKFLPDCSMIVKAGASLAFPLFVLIISFIVQMVMAKRLANVPMTGIFVLPARYPAFLIIFIFVVIGTSFFLDQGHPRLVQGLRSVSHDKNNPNVILITMDTVRADHLSLYGYERDTTPNLKKLSEDSTLYTHAIASGDMTLSTHASIFTGMYPRRHGAHYDPWNGNPAGRPLADKFHTLAEILSQKGYLTMGVVANYLYLSHSFGLNQGFQYFDQRVPVVFLGRSTPHSIRQGIRNAFTYFASIHNFDVMFRKAEDINREVFSLLDKVKSNDRSFLFINYMDAHAPYIPPPPFDTLYPGKDETFTLEHYTDLTYKVLKLKRNVTEKEYHHMISQYDGGIAYIDFQLGKLIARLKELNLYENCLIIITSDHGESFGERNLIGHRNSVYQNLVHIPLLVKYPNVRTGNINNEVVSVVDLMPTVLDVLGFEVPEHIKGQCLLKLEFVSGESRNIISESFPSSILCNRHPRSYQAERAIFSDQYKFISSTKRKRELYNLSIDQNEMENLYKEDDSTSKEIETRLETWLKTTVAAIESSAKVKLDKEALNRLKTLGYVQ